MSFRFLCWFSNNVKCQTIFLHKTNPRFFCFYRKIAASSCRISKYISKRTLFLYSVPKRLLMTNTERPNDLMALLTKRIEENNSKNILVYSRKSGGGLFINLMGIFALPSFIGFGFVTYYIFDSVNIIRNNKTNNTLSLLAQIDYGLLSFIVLTVTGE